MVPPGLGSIIQLGWLSVDLRDPLVSVTSFYKDDDDDVCVSVCTRICISLNCFIQLEAW